VSQQTWVTPAAASTVATFTSTPNTVTATYNYYTGSASSGAIVFNLPTASAAAQYCVGTTDGDVTLTVNASASGQFVVYGVNNSSSGGGLSTSSLGASTCFVGINSTTWMAYPSNGTWVTF
jgi:hypothetical protein